MNVTKMLRDSIDESERKGQRPVAFLMSRSSMNAFYEELSDTYPHVRFQAWGDIKRFEGVPIIASSRLGGETIVAISPERLEAFVCAILGASR